MTLLPEYSKHYFACANTAKGFQNFFSSNLKNLDKVYILKGGPGTGKSSLMKKIGTYAISKGLTTEFIHCSSDSDSLDGVIIPKLSTGIVDGTAPHIIEPTAPGAIEEYINLGIAWDTNQLATKREQILYLENEIGSCYPKAYDCFSCALKIHDEWEKIYISQMDFEKANLLTQNTIAQVLGNYSLDKTSTIKHRFLGASTPKGPINYVDNLTADLEKRYFIKGRPGSGKSTFLKKFVAATQLHGLDAEVYHCGFDPDSLDMVILPELKICLFDSTAPHEYFPTQSTDTVIDMYKELITPLTDEHFEKELKDISNRYKEKIAEATSHLSYAKYLHDDLEKYYITATDFTKIDAITDALLKKLDSKLN